MQKEGDEQQIKKTVEKVRKFRWGNEWEWIKETNEKKTVLNNKVRNRFSHFTLHKFNNIESAEGR